MLCLLSKVTHLSFFSFFHPGGRDCVLRLGLSDGLNPARSPVNLRVRVRDVSLHLVRNRQVRTQYISLILKNTRFVKKYNIFFQLDVFPMMRTPVGPRHLLVAASDDLDWSGSSEDGGEGGSGNSRRSREVRYTVTQGPRHGRLLFRDSRYNLFPTLS